MPITLKDDVRAVLERSTITADSLGLALESGKITSKKQELQAYYTPAAIAA